MARAKRTVTFTDLRGKRHYISANTKTELDEKLAKAKEKYNNSVSTYIENENLTLAQYFEKWIARKELSGEIKSSTIDQYQIHYKKRIKPELGNMKLQQITKLKIDDFQKRINSAEDATPTGCKSAMVLLKNILTDAYRDDIIKNNPIANVKIYKTVNTKAGKTIHRALTDEEQKLFFDELEGDFYYEFLFLMLHTGMRMGEVAALTLQDIDFENNCIYVKRTATRAKDGKRIVGTSTKSESGEREIPMNNEIKTAIQRQLQKRKIIALDNQLLFTSVRGKIVQTEQISNTIKSALERLEAKGTPIEHFSSHALRDTFASNFYRKYKDIKLLQEILGHKDYAVTADIYTHISKEEKQQAMSELSTTVHIVNL
jgi:integrase